ncbi:MAG: hypothetical protein KJO92_01250, partial [Gammaproteobacteria bacterium]|nr:hypothetical protein [Gammaproteobacteria bacterium]
DGSDRYELLAFGLRGNLFRSVDRGETWESLDSGTSVTLMNGILLRDGTVFLAGQGGVIMTRAPGQQQFMPSKNRDRRTVSGLVQKSDGNVLLAGLGGLRITDATGMPVASPSTKQ